MLSIEEELGLQCEFGAAIEGVLKTIHEAVEFAEHDEQLLTGVEDLQEASEENQAIFVVRLLLTYLDEEGRREAMQGFCLSTEAKNNG